MTTPRGNTGVARVACCGFGNHSVHRSPASPPGVCRGQAPGVRRGPAGPRGVRRGPAFGDRIRSVNYHPYGVHERVFKHTFVKGNALVTKNMVLGESVYNEKRISIQNVDGTRVEYRVWNPFRSKLGAAILVGIDYHWDFSPRGGRDLVNMAKKRTNVIPIIVHARHPARYWMLVSLVYVIFADVAQPDQARILGLNTNYFLKVGGCCLVSIKANCIDSTLPTEKVYEHEMERMRAEQLKPKQRVTLEPFERDHACVVGGYRMPIKIENELSESWCMHACLQKIVSLLRFSSARLLL